MVSCSILIELWKYGVTYPNLDTMFYQIHLIVNVEAHDIGHCMQVCI